MGNAFGAVIAVIIGAFTIRAWVIELRERFYQ